MHLPDLLGLSLSSSKLDAALSDLAKAASLPALPPPEVKPYSDIVYCNYFSLGISLSFTPDKGYRPRQGVDLVKEKLHLTAIDVYNGRKPYKPFRGFPIEVEVPLKEGEESTSGVREVYAIDEKTTGKACVEKLGEPSRKGGADGAREATVGGMWVEWTEVGLMLELGKGRWDEGGEQGWTVLTLFEPGAHAGVDTDDPA